MCESDGPIAHSAQCVYRNALFLAYMSYRGSVDGYAHPKAAEMVGKIPGIFKQDWLDGLILDPAEQRFINAPFGTLTRHQRIETSWLIEGMAVLAWAIGVTKLPPFYCPIDGAEVSTMLGIFHPDARERIEGAVLREPDEIVMGANTYGAVLWRLSEWNQNREPMEFKKRLMDSDGRHLMVDGLEFTDEDLAVDGVSLSQLADDKLRRIGGIVFQRNRQFRWLLGLERGESMVTTVN